MGMGVRKIPALDVHAREVVHVHRDLRMLLAQQTLVNFQRAPIEIFGAKDYRRVDRRRRPNY